ncbi:MAG: hypothetical protein ABJD07_14425, partial [Gemmatimonadaceae bacterium]
MNERRRPPRRGRGPRPQSREPQDPNEAPDASADLNPYADDAPPASSATVAPPALPSPVAMTPTTDPESTAQSAPAESSADSGSAPVPAPGVDRNGDGSGHDPNRSTNPRHQHQRGDRHRNEPRFQRDGSRDANRDGAPGANRDATFNGRRGRRRRGRGAPRPDQNSGAGNGPGGGGSGGNAAAPAALVADGTAEGWFDSSREGGFIRRAAASYLPTASDAFVPPFVVRQFNLRRGDAIVATTGRDHRGRTTVVELTTVNGGEPSDATRRPDFSSLTASYPERKLTLETGRSAKAGPELTRRAIDLIAPIGYGQRALIVAPARAGKTMLLQAITEGVAINHPEATLLVLLVDERPEEVSEMISWGRGEVVASSFDEPADRHVDVA